MKKLQLIGMKFGHLLVESEAETKRHPKGTIIQWNCICDCGNIRIVSTGKLTQGRQVSCGCYNREQVYKAISKAKTTHGLSKHRLYAVWNSMKHRCYNPKNSAYERYGGRGIYVCDRWKESFRNFLYDMEKFFQEGLTIERINNNGPYSPDNCKWIPLNDQTKNRRSTIYLELNGKKICLTDWADSLGISAKLIRERLNHGWSIEEALVSHKRINQFR
jgi:hypothetical protein